MESELNRSHALDARCAASRSLLPLPSSSPKGFGVDARFRFDRCSDGDLTSKMENHGMAECPPHVDNDVINMSSAP